MSHLSYSLLVQRKIHRGLQSERKDFDCLSKRCPTRDFPTMYKPFYHGTLPGCFQPQISQVTLVQRHKIKPTMMMKSRPQK